MKNINFSPENWKLLECKNGRGRQNAKKKDKTRQWKRKSERNREMNKSCESKNANIDHVKCKHAKNVQDIGLLEKINMEK